MGMLSEWCRRGWTQHDGVRWPNFRRLETM